MNRRGPFRFGLWICLAVLPDLLAAKTSTLLVDQEVGRAFQKVSESAWSNAGQGSVKRALAVLPFEEASPEAKRSGLGKTLQEIASGRASRSLYFDLIDREHLARALQEIALSQSGLVNEKNLVESGKLIGVEYFLSGVVAEAGSDFSVTLKMTSVATGKIVGLESFSIPKTVLIERDIQNQYSYIAKYGLGINFQAAPVFTATPFVALSLYDVYVNYRPFLWLNLKLGVTETIFSTSDKGLKVKLNDLYGDISTAQGGLGGIDPATAAVPYNGGLATFASPYVGADFNIRIHPKFSVAVGGALTIWPQDVVFRQTYNNALATRSTTNNNTATLGGIYEVAEQFQLQYLPRLEIKPLFFISPRMTIGLYLGYLFGQKIQVFKTTLDGGGLISFFPSGADKPPAEKSAKYWNPKLTVLGAGMNIEDVWLSGFILGGSFNFYF